MRFFINFATGNLMLCNIIYKLQQVRIQKIYYRKRFKTE